MGRFKYWYDLLKYTMRDKKIKQKKDKINENVQSKILGNIEDKKIIKEFCCSFD